MASPPEGDGRSTVEILGDERPLIRERWQALSRRARVTAAATTCVLVLGGVLAYAAAHHHPPPPPDPGDATTARITDVEMPHRTSPDFDITFRLAATSRVTYVGLAEGYGNIFVHERPGPGAVLRPGHARTLHALVDVYCASPHIRRDTPLLYETPDPHPDMPLLFAIVSNAKGRGVTPIVPTASQFDSISRAVREVCA
ncbi:hypothetical protein ACIBL8_17030 [Streptomyces sp. NPDC050523]|uniref:hypothetical protein n=1 Tax=Streptomyces sp. NPDC050523 TaxID=3365622 RepID=UPI0037BC9F76